MLISEREIERERVDKLNILTYEIVVVVVSDSIIIIIDIILKYIEREREIFENT